MSAKTFGKASPWAAKSLSEKAGSVQILKTLDFGYVNFKFGYVKPLFSGQVTGECEERMTTHQMTLLPHSQLSLGTSMYFPVSRFPGI